ncbi:MAG: hypothetical protein NZM29_08005 [Nitrospira sp.]|nr:hypothetical protein [Nitrospira sp.]
MGQHTIDVIVEKTSRSLINGQQGWPEYGVARVLRWKGEQEENNGTSYVLTLVDGPQSSATAVPEISCFPVPSSLGCEEALLAVPLAAALRAWDRLRLELGEVAVYTEGGGFADLLGLVAVWRGGLPVIRLDYDSGRDPLENGERLSINDPEETLRQLQNRIKDKPGFAAIDLSGRPEVIDLLLEVAPRWGRVMLVGQTRKSVTIDFYNNVHRKGTLLLCDVFDPAMMLKKKECETYLSAAFRLLENKHIVEICARLIPAGNPTGSFLKRNGQ